MKKFVKYKTNHGEFTLQEIKKYLQDNSPKIWSIISRITSTYDITFEHILHYIIFNDELCEINLEEFDTYFCANLPIFFVDNNISKDTIRIIYVSLRMSDNILYNNIAKDLAEQFNLFKGDKNDK